MKKTYLWIGILLTVFLLLAGRPVSAAAADDTADAISPVTVTVAFAHSYNGTTNVTGSAFHLQGADAELTLDGGAAFCFDTSLGHVADGSSYTFLGVAQDYEGEWNIEKGYRCIKAAETVIRQPKYQELSNSMKLFAVQVAVRKQQPFGPYAGVSATASADVVCNARQSQLMIDLTNEIVEKALAGNWSLPSKEQKLTLSLKGGGYYDGDYYVLAEYEAPDRARVLSVTLDDGSSPGIEAAAGDDGTVIVRIRRDRMQGTVSWSLGLTGTVQIRTLLLYAPASSGYQRLVSLQSYGAAATGSVSGRETFYGLTVYKKDAETGALLTRGQARFRLRALPSGNDIGSDGTSVFSTSDGVLTIPDILPAGTYRLEETEAPEGYISGEPISVTVPDHREVTVFNQPIKGTVSVIKTGSSYIGLEAVSSVYGNLYRPVFEDRPLSDVHFTVRDSLGTVVGEIITDDTGHGSLSGLPLGRYTLEETQTPPGYIGNTAVYEAVLRPQQPTQTVSVRNAYRQASLTIQKQAQIWQRKEEAGTISREQIWTPGEGFVFGLYTHDGFLISVGETDQNGQCVFEGTFPIGQYYVRELAVPPGYLLDDSEFDVDFGESTAVSLAIDNYLDVYPVSISKTDISGQLPLSGAVIEIYTAEEELLYRETTGEDGILPEIYLAPGRYFFREILAPEGYALCVSQTDFTVSEDGQIRGDTELKDEPTRFTGIKKGNDGRVLPGAVFTLYHESGEAAATAVSDENGVFSFEGFPMGRYTVRETGAPEGYGISEDVFAFENDGQWVNEAAHTQHTWINEEIPAPTPQKTVPAPKTGDDMPFGLFVITTALSLMGIVSVILVVKKEK